MKPWLSASTAMATNTVDLHHAEQIGDQRQAEHDDQHDGQHRAKPGQAGRGFIGCSGRSGR